MASAGSIYVELLLNDSKYVSGWTNARAKTRVALSGIQTDIQKTSGSLLALANPLSSMTTAVQNFALAMGSALSVEKIIKYADTWKQVTGRLSLVTAGTGELAARQDALFRIAQETRQPLDDIINFYTRLNQYIPEAERNQYDLLGVTQSVASALAITGESAISAQAAMIQFTQGIGTNFQAAGQELRSLQELAPRLTQAIQKALGDGKMSLQELVKAGILTRGSLLEALGGVGVEGRKLKEEMARIPVTVAQSFTILDNALLKFLGTSNSIYRSTGLLASAIKSLADNLDIVARSAIVVGAILGGSALLKMAQGFVAVTGAAAGAGVSQAAFAAAATAVEASAVRQAARLKILTAAAGTVGESLIVVGSTGRAAVASLGLVGTAVASVRGAFASLAALVGGPVVLAFIAAYAALSYFGNTYSIKNGLESLRKDVSDTYAEFAGFTQMSENARQKVVSAADARLKEAQEKWREVKALLDHFQEMPKLAQVAVTAINKLSQWTGLDFGSLDFSGMGGKGQEELMKLGAEASKTATEIGRIKREAQFSKVAQEAKELSEELQRLLAKYDEFMGGSKTERKYKEAQIDINKLVKNKAITAEQGKNILKNYSESLGVWYTSMEEMGTRTAKAIHESFSDFLFDPFKEGLGGMVTEFAKTVRRMVAEMISSKILTYLAQLTGFADSSGVVTGASVGKGMSGVGAGIGGFFSSIFDGLFATGGYIQPGHWGVAGEAGAELVYGGNTGATVIPQGGGGGGVSVNIINNNNSKVSTSSAKTGNGTELTVMIDEAVANNMQKTGSKTQQAMGRYGRRSLVRR